MQGGSREASSHAGLSDVKGALAEAFGSAPPPLHSNVRLDPGRTVGHFTIESLLGEGGMGIVYRAAQEHPARSVALKLVRSDLGGSKIARRFEYEAEALGRLHHSGIAQIYEAGNFEIDGVSFPYISMEFVEGQALDMHAAELSTTERLILLARICAAVDHAHRNGVIHRDLKPGNILVAADGQPKILDFGLARALESDLMTTTMQTQVGELLGTVPYMSPEQVAGDPSGIDHRTDVYSLGVIAHEMLCGRRPYALPETSFLEALQVIRERDPERLGSVHRDLRGDIETIVLKALEKEPARRYQTAAAFGEDVQRFLTDKPIDARPASVGYQVRKFAHRHKGLVAGLLLTLASLLAGFATTVVWYLRASENAALAEQEAEEANSARARVERQLYRANLRGAAEALASGNVQVARRLLDEVAGEENEWEWRHLDSRVDRSLPLPLPPEARSPFVEISRDGEVVLFRAGEPDSYHWKVVDRESGRERLRIEGEPQCFLTHDSQGVLRLTPKELVRWDLASGSRAAAIPVGIEDPALAHCHALNRYGVASRDQVVIFDAVTGETIAELDPATHIAYSSDGNLLVTSETNLLRVYDARTHEFLYQQRFDRAVSFSALAFHPSRNLLAAGAFDTTVRLLDCRGERFDEKASLRGSQGTVTLVEWSPDGQALAAGYDLGALRVWETGEWEQSTLHSGHDGWVTSLSFVPGLDVLVSSDSESQVLAWPVSGDALDVLRGHSSYVYPVAVSPDSRRIISAGWDGVTRQGGGVRVWDAASGAPIAKLGGHHEVFLSAVLTHDGSKLLASSWKLDPAGAGNHTGSIRVFDARTLQDARAFEGHAYWPIERLAAHPDGVRVASISRDGALLCWDLETHAVLAEFDVELEQVSPGPGLGIAFSPDGRWLAHTVGADSIRLVSAETFEPHAEWQAHEAEIWSLAFTHDTERLLSASVDDTVGVWGIPDGEPIASLAGHGQDVLCVAESPDGRRIASGGRDGFLRLWDAERFDEVARLDGHEDYIFSIAWAPNGEFLVSGSGDGTVRVYETRPLQERHDARVARDALVERLEPTVARVIAAAPSADEAVLALRGGGALDELEREYALQSLAQVTARFAEDSRSLPEHYVAPRAAVPPTIDGELDDAAWLAAAWTKEFRDIEGDVRPRPEFRTRAKMTWDDLYLYVAAELEEPHVWGTLTKHDSIVYRDNDFEIFLDPDRDVRHYYEVEINALGTVLDLMLARPYSQGGRAQLSWDAQGLVSAVTVQGTLNDPADTDKGWSVEFALPFAIFAEHSRVNLPPERGDVWKVNFSRVQWQHELEGGSYRKVPETREDNWVWSAQHTINMHVPERWGTVEFSGE